jgi:hypothetical protein
VLFGHQNVVSSLTNNPLICSYLVAREVIYGLVQVIFPFFLFFFLI